MTKQEKAALEALTMDYEAEPTPIARVERRHLRTLLRLAKRADAQDSAVARAEQAVVRAAMKDTAYCRDARCKTPLHATCSRLAAVLLKAKKARAGK